MRKYHEKGIFTVTQLSHIFKPRRAGRRKACTIGRVTAIHLSLSWGVELSTRSFANNLNEPAIQGQVRAPEPGAWRKWPPCGTGHGTLGNSGDRTDTRDPPSRWSLRGDLSSDWRLALMLCSNVAVSATLVFRFIGIYRGMARILTLCLAFQESRRIGPRGRRMLSGISPVTGTDDQTREMERLKGIYRGASLITQQVPVSRTALSLWRGSCALLPTVRPTRPSPAATRLHAARLAAPCSSPDRSASGHPRRHRLRGAEPKDSHCRT